MSDVNKENQNQNQDQGVERLSGLNDTLMGVENKLLHRALDRSRDEVDGAYEFLNKAADAGVIELGCDGCGDDDDSGQGVSDDVTGGIPPEVPLAAEMPNGEPGGTMPHMGASVTSGASQ